ncbi:MAG: FAD-dependent oxidoreductase [Tannerellaceae bacterium]|nr:FAD-dependent oxidoreductase [Tannerellaceae bacterium]
MYEIGAPVFMFSNFHKLSNFNTPPYKKVAGQLHVLDLFRTMHQANKSDFEDPRMVQLFDRYATYNGSDPYRTPATLNMIAHLENNLGAWFPRKGMYSIADSLYRLAIRQGVHFRFNTKIEQILLDKKRAVAVQTPEGCENYDIIISDADVHYVAQVLLQKHPLKSRLNRMEPSSSALIFYWGINRTFPKLDIHNILFSEDYREEFRLLSGKQTIPADPTVYIFISTKIVKEDAPEGCENWFVIINVPANTGQDWEKLTREARRILLIRLTGNSGQILNNILLPKKPPRRSQSKNGH